MRSPLLLLVSLACRTPAKPADTAAPTGDIDADGDGHVASEDCDDGDAAVFPGAIERCNGVDDDCDDDVDEGVLQTFHDDDDGDGFGDPDARVEACERPEGMVVTGTDCDDTDPEVYPAAPERCDGVDNDCDGSIDEDLVEVWYADADADGFGNADAPLDACDPPAGHVADDTDCDDTNPAAFPDNPEVCDGADNDCDGATDEDVQSTFYADVDGDGFGDSTQSVEACTAPSGYADAGGDCDDGDFASFPGAPERCDDADNDCDGSVDEDDAVDAGTWYADSDSDGYGDPSAATVACDAPSGTVADDTDCDDGDGDINPAAIEVCNGVDDDCDTDVDDDDASLDLASASTWHADSDSDGYGDPTAASTTCIQPAGTVTDDTDCDDADPTSYPGAVELRDGVDNDCDGTADGDLHAGSGSDGALSVTGTTNLSTDASGTRVHPDAVSYAVDALGTDTVSLDDTPDGIGVGDEILIINMQGTPTAHAAVGTHEFASVAAVSGTDLTLAQALTGVYGEVSNSDLTDQIIIVQRVPQYTDVDIAAGGRLTAAGWDGLSGGLLVFRASGTVSVASGGVLDMAARGYEGGTTGLLGSDCDSYQGESYTGPGAGEHAGTCAAYNEATGEWAANGGGGGAHICGGGGEHAGGASAADSWTGGSATPAEAGDTYGSADLTTLFLGSGGGGVWNGNPTCTGSGPGSGGSGGGLVHVGAGAIELLGADAVLAYGGSTTACAQGTYTYGAGGGAGGTVWLVADDLDLATASIDAEGGAGEARNIRAGGDGGDGRVRLDCGTCNGAAAGTAAAAAALGAASTPAPGHSTTP